MNSNSHPEPEERGDNTFPFDKAIRARLLAFEALPQWSIGKLALKIGANRSVVSQYLSDKGNIYTGNTVAFEKKVLDFLDNEARRAAFGVDTIECDTTDEVRKALEYIRKTVDIGVVIEASGGGKTRGMELYHRNNPTSIYNRVTMWNCAKRDLETFMFKVAGKADYDGQTKYAAHAIKVLTGSERLLIFDDAHFLHHTALLWLVQFAEVTQMPLALGGIKELLDKLQADPQIFSRVGLYYELSGPGGKDFKPNEQIIKQHIEKIAPDVGDEFEQIFAYSQLVASKSGHYRSLLKQLKLAGEFRALNKKMSWSQAFRAAHTKLIRPYSLE